MADVHVALAAETLFNVGPLPITNSILTTWIVTAVLIGFAYFATKKVSLVPNTIQNLAEIMVDTFNDLVSTIAGDKTKVFLPIVASFFFFILFGNYLGLLPGIGSIGFFEYHNGKEVFVPFLRSINSDLNTTVALALVSLFATHYLAIKYLGVSGYLGKFFALNPIFLFVGLLEIIGEATKILSLSFRLFGNIFAGEVLLTTATTNLFAYVVPIPFYFLEILVGFVQALIFAMLTLVFMVILTQKSEH
ncbi:ATP synthase F0 subunit A [Candidatus Curtissbacteria bacterium RIFCSPLOWO2_02_FULL_40_11]|uniref:ATP synthase subunit a n=2 Tax=Candidatus Curtissiibacteriota TaxID=1752717 RepID=A0A1F5GBH9_9BACT|nr:MAG: ATP synthase F0 subunit A [Candidatus Curtissbacteria bacterium RIFCSPHIGHO2_01_FULL_39_57]OGD89210.1 MAG: ATP synthase F0 subunit A [Candidatus Curtissbacteria bacterium RIFCSPHIGHO2_02_FULL_40_16b]OGE00886.1 MAG: ATP synthase F0 subunit A [Candidatus Curtissbacteria bacterium RIFCSPLOWO2_02_FULL_40_11]OGE13985.1 MAG: ATP synthase F0 subunit A [Candidatus Curtissbacteria bacterium RIFCSPLOWO2_12_FULL_38_9]